MTKEDYIKAIEELNLELKQLYSMLYYRKRRNKILIRKLIKTRRYKLAFRTKLNYLKLQLDRLFNKKDYKPKNKIYEQIKKKRTGKIIVYTCILNDYDTLYSPLLETENTSYVVFSDNKNITQKTNLWECNNNYTLINRYIKMHPHELFPNFDFALYIDGCLRVISDLTSLLENINDNTGLAMHLHSRRKDIYEEAKACLKLALGNKYAIKQLIDKYNQEGFPHHYGLFEAGIIAIDLKNFRSKIIMDNWWSNFVASKTERDQLVFTYVLWKLNYKSSDIGILGDDLDNNHKFRRVVHNYNTKKD